MTCVVPSRQQCLRRQINLLSGKSDSRSVASEARWGQSQKGFDNRPFRSCE